ncbi:helix-turn-helix transcriptional regulator [Ruegeria aquimaris]|uniref:Helix-turn-helix transcriptional regulator n=1 Tax=Ruegeria aquimaris TaxID=2984333 RepID=A0ABT3ADI1_9RHOB|nr:helix-turn-helix transcriptional regulator [Ruegeria sp. XHP0148]MCV2886731.1 helix-turn-helix transcriptional regulator [Ruegeria sp. XHP0148]
MASAPASPFQSHLQTLAQLTARGAWQVTLPHDRSHHLLVWITRGQGTCILDGAREGFGAHNALFLPARHLFILEPGRGCLGQALSIPAGATTLLPDKPQHLRIRDTSSQAELTGLLDAIGQEQLANRPYVTEAVNATANLVGIWLLRKSATLSSTLPETPARRLVCKYLNRLVTDFDSGDSVAMHAAALGVTPEHLTRTCKTATGKTASELLSGRIEHAARSLICGTKRPIGVIASDLGFASIQSFSRFVRQQTGQSPRDLRRATK